MIPQTLSIARNAFVESVRQPIVFTLVMIAGVLVMLTTWGTNYSLDYSSTSEVEADNKLLLDIGLATIFVCGMLLAAFVATSVISREIENKTILTVVAKPISRSAVILGKFFGVAGTITVSTIIMMVFMQLAIRHTVMSTAADKLDGPVLVFGLSAVAISIGVAVWCNFFYGWVFTQTAVVLMAPLGVLALVLTLLFSKDWTVQPLLTDFKPQVTIACVLTWLAVLVLTSAATAVSTRLGQVMTITVCAGLFLLGLMSNFLFGRFAVVNEQIAVVESASPVRVQDEDFADLRDAYDVRLDVLPDQSIRPGTPFYYSDSPNGLPMAVPSFPAPDLPPDADPRELFEPDVAPAVAVTQAQDRDLTVSLVGREALHVARPPRPGDFVFLRPTHVNPLALGLWAVIPNLQFFWVIDAITQNHAIPMSHVGLAGLYGMCQIGVFLCLGVVLFQKRDVG